MEQIIPSIFSAHKIKLSTSDLSQKFDKWLHACFVEQFGTVPVTKNKSQTQSRKTRTNKGLQHLRKRKKECKAARKAILKAGLADSLEEKMIAKEWLSLVRQHNKLRVELKKKQQTKAKIATKKAF